MISGVSTGMHSCTKHKCQASFEVLEKCVWDLWGQILLIYESLFGCLVVSYFAISEFSLGLVILEQN